MQRIVIPLDSVVVVLLGQCHGNTERGREPDLKRQHSKAPTLLHTLPMTVYPVEIPVSVAYRMFTSSASLKQLPLTIKGIFLFLSFMLLGVSSLSLLQICHRIPLVKKAYNNPFQIHKANYHIGGSEKSCHKETHLTLWNPSFFNFNWPGNSYFVLMSVF